MKRVSPLPDSTRAAARRAASKATVAEVRPAAPATQAGPPAHRAPKQTVPTANLSLAQQPPPAGATARCKDGTYLSSTPSPTACDANGGLAAVLLKAQQAPTPPARPAQQTQQTQQKRP
jgi:hypothetical protein